MESWDQTDSVLLTKLYVNDKLELLEICRIMKRKCKVIIGKLIELQIVKTKYEIRGNGVTRVQTQFKTQTQDQTLAPTIQLIENVNKIITQASIVCSNYSKLVTSIKNIYNPDDLKSTHS